MKHISEIALIGCLFAVGVFTAPDDSYGETADVQELLWVERGKQAVRSKLKDPDSADFRNVFFHRGSDDIPVICGEVNSKNSFGGFGGFQKFISAGSAEMTFLEEEVSDFGNLWNTLCADQAGNPSSTNDLSPVPNAPERTVAASSYTGMWAVQLGAFSNQENAEQFAVDLRRQGFAAFISQLSTSSGQLHRVRIGPQKDRESAEAMAARLQKAGHTGQVLPHP